ncbi:unnamed protein product, partial [Meganyctiphanes norvegica]
DNKMPHPMTQLLQRCLSLPQVRMSSSFLLEEKKNVGQFKGGHIGYTKNESSGIATVTLMNEKKRNAWSGQMLIDMINVLEDLQSWQVGKAVIIQGQGNTFSAGGDLKAEKEQLFNNNNAKQLVKDWCILMKHALDTISCLPLLTVSLVHGKAIGFGAEVVAATDFRLFTHSGEIMFIHAKMGLATTVGATNLVNIVSSRVALDILATCRGVNVAEALKIGLADHSVEEENRFESTVDWLQKRIEPEAEVLQTLKSNIVVARDLNRVESLLNEQNNYLKLVGGPAHFRAIEQFMKRKIK